MKISEYQALAQRTSTADHDKVLNGCLGLMGEAGEVVDVIKKWMFQSGKDAALPREKLIDELGDVNWYCAELCAGLDVDIAEVYPENSSRMFFHRLTLDGMAAHLLARAARPWHALYGEENSHANRGKRRQIALVQVAEVMEMVDEMLHQLYATLGEAMERNIEKLKKRYPDGFDPEKSLHRAEE